ncbi:ABC transporter ATP-binding protein [Rhodobacter capsulatus]|uniref:ABC transporter ATP-binding protein n=1 Tax=Rhodobacter capsulatus TaxID=1061 RepID=A0A4U1JTU8_RHOCA|nr:ABC transporter ATP-binding protein [Rhodobacter capsulatus]TKD22765.1 ABC transporter ATP-binding protein [Rhodobacter capsulatus]
MPQIELTNLSKSYGRDPAVRAVSLTVAKGDFMCLLGPSGCGKTTILRMIAGLEQVSGGEIAIGGQLVDSLRRGIFVPPERRGLGLVFQSYALWPHMTVARNIDFGLRLRNVPAAERQARLGAVMEKLCISALADRLPSQLSGGQQQRVALARALVVDPGVLLLDEPLSNLDAGLRLTMRAELARLHREFGTTIVFVTHDQWEAMTLATRIAVMRRGAVQQVGSPDQIYGQPATRFVAEFIGNPPINMIATGTPLAETLARTGALGPLARLLPQAAALGLRPEGIALDTRPGPGSLPLDLGAVLPTGGGWLLELLHRAPAETTVLTAITHRPPPWAPGTALQARLSPEALHLFDATGQRITLTDPGRRTAPQPPLSLPATS